MIEEQLNYASDCERYSHFTALCRTEYSGSRQLSVQLKDIFIPFARGCYVTVVPTKTVLLSDYKNHAVYGEERHVRYRKEVFSVSSFACQNADRFCIGR